MKTDKTLKKEIEEDITMKWSHVHGFAELILGEELN
jgi:hypothetical protein